MGLNFRWLINVGLLVLPIAASLGVLLGMQKHRHSTGQPPLFVDNGVTSTQYCQKAFGITPETTGQEYTLNPNQWGWDEGDPGKLCVDVISHNNKTYASKTRAPEFSVSWEYPQGPEDAPVHAFPNIKVDGDVFPAKLSTVKEVNIDLEWSYGIGNKTATTTDEAALTKHTVNANVAIDMFLDSDKTKSEDSTKAGYEIMVWFAMIGPATQPLGYEDGKVTTKVLDGVSFTLYYAKNNGLNVLTWLAKDITTKFNGDISPLIDEILSSKKTGFPTTSDYLGYMSLGSETLYADTTVTFHVPMLSIDVGTSASA